LNESGQVIGRLISEVIPMTDRPRVGSIHRQVLLQALMLLSGLGPAAVALPWLGQRRRAAAPAHVD